MDFISIHPLQNTPLQREGDRSHSEYWGGDVLSTAGDRSVSPSAIHLPLQGRIFPRAVHGFYIHPFHLRVDLT